MRVKLLQISIIVVLLAGAGWAQGEAQYLIIAPDSFVDAVRPLAEWKTRKGVPSRIVPLSEAGGTPEAIQAYVRDAWFNWPQRPDYVLLAGSAANLPARTYDNDCYYGNMAGDYVMELPVGRLSAENVAELRTLVAKCLYYEQLPGDDDSLWCLRGTTVVADYPQIPDPYYLADSRMARQLWLSHGYLKTESLYSLRGHSTTHLTAALNEGRAFITYRGAGSATWDYPFHDFYPGPEWQNGRQLPIIVGATCQTVTLYPRQEMLGDASVRYGTPDNLGGAVAYFGTTRVGSSISQYRSACYRGFFTALFAESVNTLGAAAVRGRWRLDSLWHDSTRYEEWTLLGDPELNVWTGMPRRIDVSHAAGINPGAQSFPVSVQDAGHPVAGARVCVMLDSVLYARDTTDAAGQAVLDINPPHAGLMSVVVTGGNLRPVDGRCIVLDTGAANLRRLRVSVTDSPPDGNGDTLLNPNEMIDLGVWLMNYGSNAAETLSARLRSIDSWVTLSDTLAGIPFVAGHDSVRLPFRFRVNRDCPDGHAPAFTVACRAANGTWDVPLEFTVRAPILRLGARVFADTAGNRNNRLDPDETSDVIVTLENTGYGSAEQVQGVLRSNDPRVVILDSLGSFGTVPARGAVSNGTDRFTLHAAAMLPGTFVCCSLLVSEFGGDWPDTLVIRVGRLGGTDPSRDGPRNPAQYWAYEDVDSLYPEHPEFDWQEIRGLGTQLPRSSGDSTLVVPLPGEFGPFVFYGQRYDRLSICTAGWLAPGETSFASHNARKLPTGSGPAMLAVNWSLLSSTNGGGIWHYHDAPRHRFIVEWDSVHYSGVNSRFDRFQILIADSTQAAPDGNSEFTYQYLTANQVSAFDVGMQDTRGQIGISLFYRGVYDTAASVVVPVRAIKFTTVPPFNALAEPVGATGAVHVPLGSAVPNPFSDRTTIVLALSEPSAVDAQVYDAAGRRVRLLGHGFLSAGRHRLIWDARDEQGRTVGPGVFYCRLRTGECAETVKLVRSLRTAD